METTNTKPENTNTVPAIREEVVSTLTPQEVKEYLNQMTEKYKPHFPMIEFFSARVSIHGEASNAASLGGYMREDGGRLGDSFDASAATFEEAFQALKKRVGDSKALAEEKRDKANKLIAEANKLIAEATALEAQTPVAA